MIRYEVGDPARDRYLAIDLCSVSLLVALAVEVWSAVRSLSWVDKALRMTGEALK